MRRKRKSSEEKAVERDSLPEFSYDLSEPGYGALVAREAAALPLSRSASHGEDYRALVDRVVGELRHLLFSLDEQQHDIVRLRNDTRAVLAHMGAR